MEGCLAVRCYGRCSAGSLSSPSPAAVAWDLSRQETGSRGLQDLGEGSLPREGEGEEEEKEAEE